MHLIEAIGLGKDWAGTSVFEGVSFSLDPGEKVGLIGPNGSGKTTLLRALAGLDEDVKGRVRRREGLRVGYAPQRFEPPAGLTAAEVLLAPARALEGALEAKGAELGRLEGRELEAALREYGELRSRYEAFGAEEAPDRAARLVDRLGLVGAADREARSLSGGEKNVLALGAVLMEEPDLLLLDEPGNHLDFPGLAWLEDFIRGERRAVLVVSHNRYLLDRTVGRLLELDRGGLAQYSGGYSAYRLEKLKRAAGQGRDWQADRARIAKLEALVARFAEIARSRPDPAWGKRLRARRSQLEREKAAAAERPDLGRARMSVSFDAAESKADFALVVRGYGKAYGDRELFRGADLDLLVGERAAIVGPNGSGKTSFLRDVVAAEGSLDGGPIRVGPSMRVGYCAQEQEVFRADRTVGQEFTALGARDEETAKLLRNYLFGREILEKRVGSLSGGERNRLQIARAVWLKANFLVLDEPTNHLDIEGREAIEEALADFDGTVLAVSHDRYFLEKVAERIFLVEGGSLVAYEGGFSEYWRDVGSARARSAGGAPGPGPGRGAGGKGGPSRAPEDRARALARSAASASSGRRGPGPASGPPPRQAELERRIAEAEAAKEALERQSAEALAAREFSRAGRLATEAEKAARLAEKLYEEWAALG